jgi:hypothetical protein
MSISYLEEYLDADLSQIIPLLYIDVDFRFSSFFYYLLGAILFRDLISMIFSRLMK